MDEPTAGLDPRAHKDIIEMLVKLHRMTECNILLVSHNMEDVAEIVDKIIVMHNGKVFSQGSPMEIYRERDRLLEIGLEVPQAMLFIKKLKDRGIFIENNVMTMDGAVQEIEKLLRERT